MAQDKEKLQLQKEMINRLKSDLESREDEIRTLHKNELIADEKLNAQNKIHAEKVRSFMNSINNLKKENQQLIKLQNEAARSKLIEQQQHDIEEQEVVIETLRKYIKPEEITKADDEIVKQLNKGPPRIRAESKEELLIKIKRLEGQLGGTRPGTGSLNGSKLQATGKSQALNQTKLSDKSKKDVSNTKMNASQMSDISTMAADSTDNLIKRLEELRTEIEETKLNLRAEQEITDKLQDEIDRKNEEIQELGGAKSDLVLLKQKYGDLMEEYTMLKSNAMNKDLTAHDKDIKVAELQIMNKNQFNTMKMAEEKLRGDIAKMEVRNEQLEVENKQITESLQSTTERLERLQETIKREQIAKEILHKDLLKTQRDYEAVNKKLQRLESQQQAERGESQKLGENLFRYKSENEKKDKRIAQLEAELENVKLRGGGGFDGMSLAQSWMSGTLAGMGGESKDMRTRLKELTRREIELQDQIEQLQEELKFREERDKAVNYLSKKKLGSTIEQEELKRQYQKEIQARYEKKITDLCLKIKEVESRNKELVQVHRLIEQGEGEEGMSDIGSEISVSIGQLEKLNKDERISDVSQLSELKKEMVMHDHSELKTKLIQMTSNQIELQNKITKMEQLLGKQQDHRMQSKEEMMFSQKMDLMKEDYQKIINNLSKKVADLEMKDVNLKLMDSNVGSDLLSQPADQHELDNLNSEIDFSMADLHKQEVNISQISSTYGDVMKEEDQKKDNQDDLKSVSSRISNISGMDKKKVYM